MSARHVPSRNLMPAAFAAFLCLFLSACFSVYLNYYIYEPSVENFEGTKCALCKWTGYRIAPNALTLAFKEFRDEISVAAYDPFSYQGFIYHYGPLSNRTETLSERHSTRVVQLRITLACTGASNFVFFPGKIKLVDQQSGLDIPLRLFSEYVPAEPTPSSKSINEGVLIDRGEPIDCQGHKPRSVTAMFDFYPSLTTLRLNFEDSLSAGGTDLNGLNVQLRLNAHSDYLHKTPILQYG